MRRACAGVDEEVLERVQLGPRRSVDPAANLKREEPIRREAPACGRDQATHEPEPVTLGEDGAHRLRGELRMALTLAEREVGQVGDDHVGRPRERIEQVPAKDGDPAAEAGAARIQPGQLNRSRADVRRPDGGLRRGLGDRERDRAGAGPHVDDHARHGLRDGRSRRRRGPCSFLEGS